MPDQVHNLLVFKLILTRAVGSIADHQFIFIILVGVRHVALLSDYDHVSLGRLSVLVAVAERSQGWADSNDILLTIPGGETRHSVETLAVFRSLERRGTYKNISSNIKLPRANALGNVLGVYVLLTFFLSASCKTQTSQEWKA